jgi:hypothetical protein
MELLRGLGLANPLIHPPRITHAQANSQDLQAVGQDFDKYRMISSDTTWARGLTGTKLIGSTRTNESEQAPVNVPNFPPQAK